MASRNHDRTYFTRLGVLGPLLSAGLCGSIAVACSSDDPGADTQAATGTESTGSTSSTTGSGTVAGTTAGTSAGTTGTPTNVTSGSSSGTSAGTNGTSGGTDAGTVGNTTGNTSAGPVTSSNTGAGGNTSTATVTTGVQTGDCGITVDSYDLSEAIPTVGIVTWAADTTPTSASIQFGPADGAFTMTAPVDLNEPGYRTLLLGMKENSDYNFQIVAEAGGETCTSEVLSLTTGPVSNGVPIVDITDQNAAAVAPGFTITVAYTGNMAFIYDQDGDPVWWTPSPPSSSGIRMSWDGKYMWMVTGNPFGGQGQGQIRRVSMDGTEVTNVPGTTESHHDLAPLPDGSVAAILHGTGQDACSSIVNIAPDLSITPIVADVSTIYTPVGDCHPNSILYHEADDSFTISDRNPNMYVKIDHETAEVQWRLGGDNALGPHIEQSWTVNHGHHLLDNGNMLIFNNTQTGAGNAIEFEIDVNALMATEVFRFTGGSNTSSLGDVQRLPNGNTMVTYSNAGVIYEVDASKNPVRTINTDPLGYAMKRESLYGKPPK